MLGQWLQQHQHYLPIITLILLGLGLILIFIVVMTAKRLRRRRAESVALARPLSIGKSMAEHGQNWGQRFNNLMQWCQRFIGQRRAYLNDETLISIKKAVAFLQSYWGRNAEYRLPWFLFIDAEPSGKADILQDADLQPAMARVDYQHIQGDLEWWLYDRAVIVNIPSLPSQSLQTTDESVWTKIAQGLAFYRAKKPLDGIILTLAAADLYGDIQDSETMLKSRAQTLQDRLWLLQRKLGMRLPLYVIVTHCETIAGFQSLVAELPAHNRGDIFGWSSPHSLDNPFSTSWLQEMFTKLIRSLITIRTALFTHSDNNPERDNNFSFVHEFTRLQHPLSLYLQTLFKDNAYQESFFLRGVYFTGQASVDLRSLPQSKENIFLKDLFNKKIFAEPGLAQPITRLLISRNQRFTAIKLAVAAALTGWLMTAAFQKNRTIENNKVAVSALAAVDDALKGLHDNVQDGSSPHRLYLERQTAQLLEHFAAIKSIDTWSLTWPSSWFNSLDDHIAASFKQAYNRIILPTLETALIKRGHDIINPNTMSATRSVGDKTTPYPNPTQLPTFIALQNYVNDIVLFEEAVNRYNNLEKSRSIQDLGMLINTLFHKNLPKEFYSQSHDLNHTLELAVRNPIAIDTFKIPADRKLGMLFKNFMDDAFVINRHYALFTNLEKRLENLSHVATHNQFNDDQLRNLVQEAITVADVLSSDQWEWINKSVFEPHPQYSTVMDQIVTSTLLGKVVGDELTTIVDRAFAHFKLALANFKSLYTGSFLAIRNDYVTAEPSSGLIAFIDAVTALLDEPFMAKGSYQPLDSHGQTGKLLFWEDELLRKAVRVIESVDNYMQQRAGQAPERLRSLFKSIAQNSARRKVTTLIAQAQSYQTPSTFTQGLSTTDALQSQVQNLATVTPAFAKILGAMEAKSYLKEAMLLKRLLVNQTHSLLMAIDRTLDTENLYRGRNDVLTHWNGEPMVGLQAFAVQDLGEMRNYLNAQRYRIHFLAKDLAEPVLGLLSLGFLESAPQSLSLVYKWSRIAAVIQDYETLSPTNSLKILEKFLVHDINAMTLEQCTASDDSMTFTDITGDYFLEVRHDILQKLQKRCHGVISQRTYDQYNQAATFFNQRLAGRFPFVNDEDSAQSMDADPRDVQEFFTIINDVNKQELFTLINKKQKNHISMSVQRFLQQIHSVQPFMGAPAMMVADNTLDKPKPMVTLKLAFRSQRQQEQGGDKLIDWTLSSGSHKVTFRDEQPTLSWQVSMPVQVGFRWAADASTVPIEDSSQPDLNIDGPQALFNYSGPWSLLRLMRNHVLADVNHRDTDDSTMVLRFEVPTLYNPACYHDQGAGAQNLNNPPLQVFATLTLTLDDEQNKGTKARISETRPASKNRDPAQNYPSPTRTTLSLPTFPDQAPVINPTSLDIQKPSSKKARILP